MAIQPVSGKPEYGQSTKNRSSAENEFLVPKRLAWTVVIMAVILSFTLLLGIVQHFQIERIETELNKIEEIKIEEKIKRVEEEINYINDKLKKINEKLN